MGTRGPELQVLFLESRQPPLLTPQQPRSKTPPLSPSPRLGALTSKALPAPSLPPPRPLPSSRPQTCPGQPRLDTGGAGGQGGVGGSHGEGPGDGGRSGGWQPWACPRPAYHHPSRASASPGLPGGHSERLGSESCWQLTAERRPGQGSCWALVSSPRVRAADCPAPTPCPQPPQTQPRHPPSRPLHGPPLPTHTHAHSHTHPLAGLLPL